MCAVVAISYPVLFDFLRDTSQNDLFNVIDSFIIASSAYINQGTIPEKLK